MSPPLSVALSRYIPIYVLGTIMLSLGALYNGYPLVYWDSGAYLRALIEWHNLPDRPVLYSLWLGLWHWRFSLWPVVFGQSILTVFVIERVLARMVPRNSTIVALSVLLALTVATSLPWFTGQIMPYFFAPIVPLSLYMLCVEQGSIARWEFRLFFGVLVLAEATHYSHVALAMGLILLLGLVGCTLRWIPMRNLVPAVLATMLAAGSVYAVNYLARRELVFGPYNSILLLDRLLEYRTAQAYLARTCPTVSYEICPYLNELERLPAGFGGLMWNDAGVLSKLGGAEHYSHEATRLTRDIILDAPVRHAWLALEGGAHLFVEFPTGDEFGSYGQGTQIYRMIDQDFSREAAEFMNSREQRGTLTFGFINAIDIPVGFVSVFAAVLLLTAAVSRRDRRLVMFLGGVLATLIGNALICGGLSSGDAHYQSRMMPLVVFAAVAGSLRLLFDRPDADQTAWSKLPPWVTAER